MLNESESKFHPYTHIKKPNGKNKGRKGCERKRGKTQKNKWNLQCGFYCVRELRNGNEFVGRRRTERMQVQFNSICIRMYQCWYLFSSCDVKPLLNFFLYFPIPISNNAPYSWLTPEKKWEKLLSRRIKMKLSRNIIISIWAPSK